MDVKELRLLIGNTSNQETIEQMAEGYRRLEMVVGATEEQLYQKGAESGVWQASQPGRSAIRWRSWTRPTKERSWSGRWCA